MTLREWYEASAFMRRVRRDFATRDAIADGELDPELGCACGLCWAENFAAVRALEAVAAPGMSQYDIDLAVWEYMHTEGPWAWKRREGLRFKQNDNGRTK